MMGTFEQFVEKLRQATSIWGLTEDLTAFQEGMTDLERRLKLLEARHPTATQEQKK